MNVRIALLVVPLVGCCWAATTAEAARPNIVLMVSDDQRPDTIAALGNPHIDTPHLDRLAREGASFTRAVAAFPLCFPSRAEILTGCTSFRTGVPYSLERWNDALASWPATFRDAGYHTWYVGKWHNHGTPAYHGYAETNMWYGSGGGEPTYPHDHRGKEVTGYRGWQLRDSQGNRLPELGIGLTPDISEHFADAAVQFINRGSEKPFFLHVNFTAPHDPLFFPTRFRDKYDPDKIPLPPNYAPEHPFDHGNQRGRDELLMDFPRTPEEVRRELAVYYAVVSHMDEQVGRILAALDETGQSDNTLVIFTSDHGMAVGSHGLRGKQNMYEHTLGVPLLMRGPGVPANTRIAAQCYLRDLFPTCCEVAGIAIPQTVEARSLWPVVTGRAERVYDEIYGYFWDSQRAIRTDRWKLIHYPHLDRYQLFDVQNDPHELTDLIGESAHADLIEELKGRLLAWRRANADPLLTGAPWNSGRRSGQVQSSGPGNTR